MNTLETPADDQAVSIIIPVYNCAKYIGEAIQSVLAQTFPDFELIVVDDGSTDRTPEIIHGFTDPRLRYHYQNNQGLAGARNSGINLARGRFVAFLDADDIFLPHKLEDQLGWFRAHPESGFVSGGWNVIDESGKVLGSRQLWTSVPDLNIENWLFYCPVLPISVLVRKEWVDHIGGFDPGVPGEEDWDLWIRLAWAGCKMGWSKEIVSSYRIFPGQMSRNAAGMKRSSIKLLDKFFDQNNLPGEILRMKQAVYTDCYIRCAGREYSVNQIEDAQYSIKEALKSRPDLIKDRCNELIVKLLEWTDDPYIGDPIDYTRRVMNGLPLEAQITKAQKRWALGEIALRRFFQAYAQRNWKEVRQAAAIVGKNDPARLFNRGIWSILVQSFGSRSTN